MKEKTPVFVKIGEYRKVLDLVDNLKTKIGDVRSTIAEIKDLREQEQDALNYWESNIDDIEKKVMFVDQTLFEPEA